MVIFKTRKWLNIESDFTYKGFWWFPEKPDEQFPGDLEIDTTGNLILTIIDGRTTRDNLIEKIENNRTISVINGYARNKSTKKDLAFTLFNNLLLASNVSGLSEFTFHCSYATTYKHFDKIDALTIGAAFLDINLLNEWITISGIGNAKHKSKKFKFSIEYAQPKPVTILKTKDFHLYIWFKSSLTNDKRAFRFNEKPRINIEFKKAIDYKKLNKYIQLIQNFFSFCISVPVHCEKIEFWQYTSTDLKKLNEKTQHAFDLIISDSRTYTKIQSLRGRDMLLEYKKIAANVSTHFLKWLELNNKYEPVFQLYFDTLYNPGLYKENVFLNNIAALEVYHRINNPKFDEKKDRYISKYNNILAQIKNDNDKNWIKARLDKKKEASLFARILNIVERTPTLSKEIIGDFSDFATVVSNTRNYLTHFDYNKKEKGIAEDEQLIELIGKTRILIQAQILMDLGFSESETNTLIKNAISNWYTWTR